MSAIDDKYKKEFDILKINGGLVGEWGNVYNHCKLEGEIAEILSKLLKLSESDSKDLVIAAILHDWYKRAERESADRLGCYRYYEASHESRNGIIEFGYSDMVADISGSVGSLVLKEVFTYDTIRKAMNYIDNICHGDKIVDIDERIDLLESSKKYVELNESGRKVFNGKTLFEVQRERGRQIQNELEGIIGIPKDTLTQLIKIQHESIYNRD